MRGQDTTLQYWSERIESLSEEYERAKYNTSHLHNQVDSAWQTLHELQEQYREYKERSNYEFQKSQYCRSMHDRASAKEYNENRYIINEKKAEISSYLDGAYAGFDSVKSQFNDAVAYQRRIKAELDQARSAHKLRIEELKAQNLQEQMHWKEKNCDCCGATIRYNDIWDHIPNYCKFCKEKMDGEHEKRVMLTKSNRGKTYFEDKKNVIEEENFRITEKRMPMLFVSHATADKKYVEYLVAFFENIGFDNTQMICSSVPGYGIPLNTQIYDWIAEKFRDWDLYVIFILSDKFYKSTACLMEMGATWITRKEYTSILFPGFEFSQIKGAIRADRISIKLDSDKDELKQRLDEMKDTLTEKFGLIKVSDTKWEKIREKFIDSINGI